jgi:hypothetical protein
MSYRGLVVMIAVTAMATATGVSARAPSLVPSMPDEVHSIRDCRLEKQQYESLAADWRGYLDRNPRCAVAEVQLGRALRYAGAPANEVIRHFARALELDPGSPEALDAAAATYLGEWKPLAEGAAGCYQLGLKAVDRAPEWADPHFTLWPLALLLGRTQEADEQISLLLRKGGIPSPVLDYCYNMLVGAEQNAIIFTNGDNDTYGCRALQVTYGLRLDVHVLNLSLISQPEIEAEVFRRFGDRTPLSAAERAALRSDFQANFSSRALFRQGPEGHCRQGSPGRVARARLRQPHRARRGNHVRADPADGRSPWARHRRTSRTGRGPRRRRRRH